MDWKWIVKQFQTLVGKSSIGGTVIKSKLMEILISFGYKKGAQEYRFWQTPHFEKKKKEVNIGMLLENRAKSNERLAQLEANQK